MFKGYGHLLICGAIIVSGQKGFAWAEHHILTKAALSTVAEIQSMKVKVSDANAMFRALGYQNQKHFNETILIHRDFVFACQEIPAIDVLSIYSDEPDWDMDMNLFDQYPELWSDDYQFMGGRTGTSSQAFRHLHWLPFELRRMLKTFKLPLHRLNEPMGEAPHRARLFVSLSRRAREAGHPYWALRFLANASHYLEDVNSPFHSSQTPTKLFLTLPFTDYRNGSQHRNYVQQITHIVSYYHFAFEDYIGLLTAAPNSTEGAELLAAVRSSSKAFPKLTYQQGIENLVTEMTRESNDLSAAAGRASLNFFPKITEPFATFDAKKFMNESWWQVTVASGQEDSHEKQQYFRVVKKMFAPLGVAVREFVKGEVVAPLGN
jgi:hypothetical protein